MPSTESMGLSLIMGGFYLLEYIVTGVLVVGLHVLYGKYADIMA